MNPSSTMAWLQPLVPSTQAQAQGMVFIVRCVPDMFTGEMLNIGVCGIDKQGVRHAKVITETGRLTCLYGESAHNIVNLAAVAREAAEKGLPPPSKQIIFTPPTPFFHAGLEAVVNSTFADQVTVALPQRASAGTPVLDDEAVLAQVTDAVKQSMEFNMDVLANTPQVLINTQRGPRTVNVPLQPRNGVGTIRSAYYAAPTVRTHLLDSVLDMEFAARYRSKQHMAIFILRPATANRSVMKQMDATIDSIAARAPHDMRLEVEYDVPALAGAVNAWAEQAQ